MVYNCIEFILNTLFPATCLLCHVNVDGKSPLCHDCVIELPRNRQYCSHCAIPLPDCSNHRVCGNCQNNPPSFDAGFAPFLYQGPLPRLVTELKFNQHLNLAHLMGNLLALEIQQANLELPELLIPVPLHVSRLRSRGFNQALEIAKQLSHQLEIPVSRHSCRRNLATTSQSRLKLKQRQSNLNQAFEIRKPIKARHVALIDDVITSGSTMQSLAKTLRLSGVEQIQVWSVARTPKMQ